MSHFTVLVIGDNPEQQLAPFQENNMGDCPKEYLKFHDIEDEYRAKYETDQTSAFVSPEGEAHCKYDKQFADYNSPDYNPQRTPLFSGDRYVCPEGWTEAEVSVKEIYPTFEGYIEDYCGYTKDNAMGRYGYWENPNAKWDWYTLGGRWSGFFAKKDGGETDQDVIENLDFESKLREKYEFALGVYDYLWPHIKDTPPIESWEVIREGEKELGGTDYIERARTRYHAQPRMVAYQALQDKLRSISEQSEIERIVYWMDNMEDFNDSREVYAQKYAERCVQTFAVLKDGRWYERGKMGWWACVSDEKDQETWNSIYQNLIKNLPNGTLLSLYDCHI